MKKVLLIILCSFWLGAFAQQNPKVIIIPGTNNLIPEGIVVDPRTGKIYVSSIYNRWILEIDSTGKFDTIVVDCPPLGTPLGLKFDSSGMLYGVANWRGEDSLYHATLYGRGVPEGKCFVYKTLTDTARHLFNDLIIDDQRNVFITDTYYSAIYWVNGQVFSKGKLSLFVKSGKLAYPNGIVHGRGNLIYIATYYNGLMMLNKRTKKLKPLGGYKDSAIAYGLDGLMKWKNSLIGIYNLGQDASKNAIVQYFLNDAGTVITGERIIDRGHPAFRQPTTASLVGNKLYVIANSNLAAFNNNKESVTGIDDQLTPLTILIYELK